MYDARKRSVAGKFSILLCSFYIIRLRALRYNVSCSQNCLVCLILHESAAKNQEHSCVQNILGDPGSILGRTPSQGLKMTEEKELHLHRQQ